MEAKCFTFASLLLSFCVTAMLANKSTANNGWGEADSNECSAVLEAVDELCNQKNMFYFLQSKPYTLNMQEDVYEGYRFDTFDETLPSKRRGIAKMVKAFLFVHPNASSISYVLQNKENNTIQDLADNYFSSHLQYSWSEHGCVKISLNAGLLARLNLFRNNLIVVTRSNNQLRVNHSPFLEVITKQRFVGEKGPLCRS